MKNLRQGLLFVVLLTSVGCTNTLVTPITTEKTGPVLSWKVYEVLNGTLIDVAPISISNNQAVLPSAGVSQADPTQYAPISYSVVLNAFDTGGIQKITLNCPAGSFQNTQTIANPIATGTASTSQFALPLDEPSNLLHQQATYQVGANGKVPANAEMAMSPFNWSCGTPQGDPPQTFYVTTGTLTVTGTATNFSGVTSTTTLQLSQ